MRYLALATLLISFATTAQAETLQLSAFNPDGIAPPGVHSVDLILDIVGDEIRSGTGTIVSGPDTAQITWVFGPIPSLTDGVDLVWEGCIEPCGPPGSHGSLGSLQAATDHLGNVLWLNGSLGITDLEGNLIPGELIQLRQMTNVQITAIPEPSAVVLALVGVLMIASRARRR